MSAFFGLLQIWLTIGASFIIRDFSYDDFFLNGSLLFFVTAIVTSLATDYYLSKRPYPELLETAAFTLFPGIIIIVSVWLFGVCLGKDSQEIYLPELRSTEYAILFMTGVYALAVKFFGFEED